MAWRSSRYTALSWIKYIIIMLFACSKGDLLAFRLESQFRHMYPSFLVIHPQPATSRNPRRKFDLSRPPARGKKVGTRRDAKIKYIIIIIIIISNSLPSSWWKNKFSEFPPKALGQVPQTQLAPDNINFPLSVLSLHLQYIYNLSVSWEITYT